MPLPNPTGTGAASLVESVDDESRVFRKIAWRLMPFLFVVYVLSYLDRVNIGYAQLQFSADLGFSNRVYGLGAGVFFVGYMLFEIPSNIFLERVGARATISRIMVLWGTVSMGTMFIHTATSFYIMRFLLGVAEAGLVPGVVLYLTYWFPANMRARLFALFLAAIPVSGVIGAPMSGYMMMSLQGVHNLHGWQWMFLIEGVPSVVVGICAYFYLTNRPADARWLSLRERGLVAARLAKDRDHRVSTADSVGRFSALTSGRFWLLTGIYLCLSVGNAGFSFWLPQIIKDLGVSSIVNNGLITAIPYLVACVGMVAMGYSSDRSRERRWHYAINSLVGAIGLVACCVFGKNLPVAVAGLALSYLGILSCYGIFWSSATSFLRAETAAVGIASINSIVSVASFSSPFALGMIRDATHNLNAGLYLIAACLVLGAVLALRLPKLKI